MCCDSWQLDTTTLPESRFEPGRWLSVLQPAAAAPVHVRNLGHEWQYCSRRRMLCLMGHQPPGGCEMADHLSAGQSARTLSHSHGLGFYYFFILWRLGGLKVFSLRE
jgi:hypothetical protein